MVLWIERHGVLYNSYDGRFSKHDFIYLLAKLYPVLLHPLKSRVAWCLEYSKATISEQYIHSEQKMELPKGPQMIPISPHSGSTTLQGAMPTWSPASTYAFPVISTRLTTFDTQPPPYDSI